MLEKRFTDKLEVTHCGCWQWIGARDGKGYGRYMLPRAYAREHGISRNRAAHRYSWEALVGPIPDGLSIDHLCRNRMCVNPDHLEPVTHLENVRRGAGPMAAKITANSRPTRTHCAKGHEFTDENSYYYPGKKHLKCRTCVREYQLSRKPPKKDRTHCRNGHDATGWNTYTYPSGKRVCRTCMYAAQRRYLEKKRASTKPRRHQTS